MNTSSVRLFARLALATLAIASSRVVLAELPQLASIQQIAPTGAEVAADSDGSIFFGQGVAIDRDDAMVTMPEYGAVPGYTVGRIAIYHRFASGQWNRVGTFAPGPDEGFGSTVVLKQGTAFFPGAGGIHVYRKKLGAWTQTATLTLPPGRPITFGSADSIKYDDGTVIVSAFYTDDFTSMLLVYRLNAAGEVIGRTQLFASDTEQVRGLGAQDDLQGDTIVASGNVGNELSVYVFQRFGSRARLYA